MANTLAQKVVQWHRSPTLLPKMAMSENRPKFRRWSLRCLFIGFMLAMLTAIILYVAVPPQYPATAHLQMRATAPTFLFETPPLGKYDLFVNTQIALLRSPVVLGKALQEPDIMKLPILRRRDPRAYLASKLRIKREGHSEIVSVSIKTDSDAASLAIVDAVIDAYLKYVDDSERNAGNRLLMELNAEKRRQYTSAQVLQDNIRSLTKKDAAGSEEVQLDIAFNQTQLERLNKTIDKIEDRILAVQSESRAPGQIVHLSKATSSAPDTWEKVIAAGVGFVVVAGASIVVFFAILCLGIVLDCMRLFGSGRKKRNDILHCSVSVSETDA